MKCKISKADYLKAKKLVEIYEKHQLIDNNGSLLLNTVFSREIIVSLMNNYIGNSRFVVAETNLDTFLSMNINESEFHCGLSYNYETNQLSILLHNWDSNFNNENGFNKITKLKVLFKGKCDNIQSFIEHLQSIKNVDFNSIHSFVNPTL